MKVSRHETVTVLVNPWELRKMAEEMEQGMASSSPGDLVWVESCHDYERDLEVRLVADQEWFQRREEGSPNWDAVGPCDDVLKRFRIVKDSCRNEEREFPNTYSGTAWRAAYRMWAAFDRGEATLEGLDAVDVKGIGLSGFQHGWAVNAVRQMLGAAPGTNPAIITIGGPSPIVPALGPAYSDMRSSMLGDRP